MVPNTPSPPRSPSPPGTDTYTTRPYDPRRTRSITHQPCAQTTPPQVQHMHHVTPMIMPPHHMQSHTSHVTARIHHTHYRLDTTLSHPLQIQPCSTTYNIAVARQTSRSDDARTVSVLGKKRHTAKAVRQRKVHITPESEVETPHSPPANQPPNPVAPAHCWTGLSTDASPSSSTFSSRHSQRRHRRRA